jgi:hypothetical protein
LIPLCGLRKSTQGKKAGITLNMENTSRFTVYYHQLKFEPQYASTIHALQGQTVESLILDFNDISSYTMPMLYVLMSRCRTGESYRVLPYLPGTVMPPAISNDAPGKSGSRKKNHASFIGIGLG